MLPTKPSSRIKENFGKFSFLGGEGEREQNLGTFDLQEYKYRQRKGLSRMYHQCNYNTCTMTEFFFQPLILRKEIIVLFQNTQNLPIASLLPHEKKSSSNEDLISGEYF